MWMKLGVGAVEQVSGMIHARTGRCEGIEGVEARQTSHQNLGLLGDWRIDVLLHPNDPGGWMGCFEWVDGRY